MDPSGAIHHAVTVAGEAVPTALGQPPGSPRSHGTSAPRSPNCSRRTASSSPSTNSARRSRRPSPQAYLDEQAEHPLAVAGRAILDPRDESDALRERMLPIYEAANEDPHAFRVTSRYVVATARRRA
jgi:hypothetical protein